jgi:hypothetical protein
MRSRSTSARARAFSGLPPAPRPGPNCSFRCASLRLSAWASVLAQMNSTPCTPSRIMWSTALPPAPPTPTTLMTVPLGSLSMISNMLASL